MAPRKEVEILCDNWASFLLYINGSVRWKFVGRILPGNWFEYFHGKPSTSQGMKNRGFQIDGFDVQRGLNFVKLYWFYLTMNQELTSRQMLVLLGHSCSLKSKKKKNHFFKKFYFNKGLITHRRQVPNSFLTSDLMEAAKGPKHIVNIFEVTICSSKSLGT